jgi:predicted ATPase/signal transduction histidine kinase
MKTLDRLTVATRMPPKTPPAGYVLEPLRKGSDFTLYRGYEQGNPSPILAVTITAEQPPPQSLKQLEHEYALRDTLDPDWAAQPLALVARDGRMTLVLADPGGELLDRLLGQPLALTDFMRIGISLVRALRRAHESGLIHKDIKPANVLMDMESGCAWLTGFGIASRLPREQRVPEPPEVIAGTLAYMAPEQTGRMNRSIDSRSDLYALGVTFYEMLTGVLPFAVSDPMEWIHCHIARRPVPPSERVATVPVQLSAIVMKLLAKTAEERYQTVAGVEADLRRCRAVWISEGRIESFPLGSQDASDRLLLPEKLYGREHEIDVLLSAFDRVVATSTPELVLVSGYSGIGKSSVVHELHKALVLSHGLFASGKFDQYKRDVPYATLAQAFQSLVRPLLGQSEEDLGRWRDPLREALGPNGQLIVNLVPELELVLGPQPPVAELPPQDAKNRFQMVFRRFVAVFARREHPLALFLDDLQWLDAATLDLLEHLVIHSEVRHLLLVGAYRDNEVGPSHPLLRTLDAIRTAGARVQEIVLGPLGLDYVGQLVTEALHCEPERALPLAQLVHEKTGGNPFFAIQFFTALADEGLLAFDPLALAWQWDIDRIRARSYADNVVELMAGKLSRLSAPTQEALKQLACLGNVAEISTLTLVHAETEEAMHDALAEAVYAGLILHQGSTYKFLHDRIHQAAYSLIPEEGRAEAHLRIGRVLLARMSVDQLAEHLFDVANQFNRCAPLLVDQEERVQVATIDLRAGRKAKASAAYASARAYFGAGMALLDECDWGSRYELTFNLWLECAECEFLSGNFEKAEQLIAELLRRAASKVGQAAAYQVKVLLHIVKAENKKAVDCALECLRLFGIDLPAHPTFEQVQAEYQTVWEGLDSRPIESLIDLPLMTDPDLQAAMKVLSVLTPASYDNDIRLFCLIVCRMVNISAEHGISGASAHGYAHLGSILGPVFHRYSEACRFAKLACDLVEKHGFISYQAKAYNSMGLAALWTQPITTAINFLGAMFRAATETGDLTYACYAMYLSVTNLVVQNAPLDAVWRESEMALDFVRKAGFRDVAEIIRSQQRFVATMQGRTASFSTFSDAHFDEATFEAQLTADRLAQLVCYYWIVKLKTRFLSGDYAEALAAADKAKPLLGAAAAQIQLLDYFYYTALTVAALFEKGSTVEQTEWRELLSLHNEQLCEWADIYPPTFADKHELVSAEIARIDGRDFEAMRLYEEAIRSARENGFVQNEGLAHEVAARFYAARGFEMIAHAYLRNARYCYLRWGAEGKVRQLDRSHPQLREDLITPPAIATMGTAVTQLDVQTVVKASQALSSEIVLPMLIERLMRIAVEHAGAERGLLILLRSDKPQIEAVASTGRDGVEVNVRQQDVTASELPQSALHYVIRTRERVVLDDACTSSSYSDDAYVRENRPRSVLCLPIIQQTKLVGALYLENNLTPRAFTSQRVAVLELLASQAAISLENARLYSDLQRSEAFLAEGQSVSSTGSFGWNVQSREIHWSDETYRIFEYDRAARPRLELVLQRVHPDDRTFVQETIERAAQERTDFDFEHRLLMPDGAFKHLHVIAHFLQNPSGTPEFVGAVMDVTSTRQAEAALQKAQADLAHVSRVTTMGELVASIAHEVNQPLGAIVTNGHACVRLLSRDVPDLNRSRQVIDRMINDGIRASEVIKRIRDLLHKAPSEKAPLNINETVQEVIALVSSDVIRSNVELRADLGADLPPVVGDRIQLQQVILNLILNGRDAMSGAQSHPRELLITSRESNSGEVMVAVRDSGIGLDPKDAERIFDPFFTTKSEGMGLGLSISRTIIEAHGGTLWAKPNKHRGATIQFTLPST